MLLSEVMNLLQDQFPDTIFCNFEGWVGIHQISPKKNMRKKHHNWPAVHPVSGSFHGFSNLQRSKFPTIQGHKLVSKWSTLHPLQKKSACRHPSIATFESLPDKSIDFFSSSLQKSRFDNCPYPRNFQNKESNQEIFTNFNRHFSPPPDWDTRFPPMHWWRCTFQGQASPFPGASWIFIPKNKTLMLPKFIQICLNLTCSSVKQGSCLQSCSSWASFPLRCLLIGSAPRFRPFFFVTSSSPIVQWEFRMGVSEFSSSIMCFVLVEGGRWSEC